MIRFAVASLVLASVVGCTAEAASPTPPVVPPTHSAQPPRSEAASPSPSPQFTPGPDSAGGTVTRIDQHRVAIRNAIEELDVDLTRVRSVWRETEVAPADLEVGDELFLNGTRDGMTFRAAYVYANIGRVDGVIRAIHGTKLVDGRPATIADLRAGMTIGAVVYRPKNSTMRATKVWF